MEPKTKTSISPEGQSEVKAALEDITLIKRMISRSEVNMHSLGALFLIYGIVSLIFIILRSFVMVLLTRTLSLQQIAVVSYVSQGISLLITVALFIVFIRMRRRMIPEESHYTMKLFDLWGIMLFAPVLFSIVPLIHMLAASVFKFGAATDYFALIYNTVFAVMKYGAVCMCIFFTGHYIDNLFMKLLSLALMIVFPIMCGTGVPALFNITPGQISSMVEAYGYFSSITSVGSLLLILVYIVMGIVFLVKRKGETNGNT